MPTKHRNAKPIPPKRSTHRETLLTQAKDVIAALRSTVDVLEHHGHTRIRKTVIDAIAVFKLVADELAR